MMSEEQTAPLVSQNQIVQGQQPTEYPTVQVVINGVLYEVTDFSALMEENRRSKREARVSLGDPIAEPHSGGSFTR